MRCLVVIVLTCGFLLSATVLRSSYSTEVPSVGTAMVLAQGSRTELMQQSDHKRRIEHAKSAQAGGNETAAVAVTEPVSRDYDYIALAILAVSVVILAFAAGRRRRARLRF